MIGHVGGIPIEELLLPFLAGSGTMLWVAVRARFARATTGGAAQDVAVRSGRSERPRRGRFQMNETDRSQR